MRAVDVRISINGGGDCLVNVNESKVDITKVLSTFLPTMQSLTFTNKNYSQIYTHYWLPYTVSFWPKWIEYRWMKNVYDQLI